MGFRNYTRPNQKLFRRVQKLFSSDAETIRRIQKLFSSDSDSILVGFRSYTRGIQKLFSSDSDSILVGFRNYFVGFINYTRRIHRLWGNSETAPWFRAMHFRVDPVQCCLFRRMQKLFLKIQNLWWVPKLFHGSDGSERQFRVGPMHTRCSHDEMRRELRQRRLGPELWFQLL